MEKVVDAVYGSLALLVFSVSLLPVADYRQMNFKLRTESKALLIWRVATDYYDNKFLPLLPLHNLTVPLLLLREEQKDGTVMVN